MRRHLRRLATALATVLLGVGCLVATSSAASAGIVSRGRFLSSNVSLSDRVSAPGEWSLAQVLPGSAALNTGNNAGVNSISCTSSGNCSAGGSFTDTSGHLQAFVVVETNGVWGNAIEAPGTGALNTGGNAQVLSVSCSSVGNCGAAGYYTDSSNDVQGFVMNESGSSWGNAVEVVDPSAIDSPNALGAESISCTGTGSCSAVGDDVVVGGSSVGFAVNETGGNWGDADEITISSTFGAGGTSLDQVSCSSSGNCSAAGNGVYADSDVTGGYVGIPFEVSEAQGTWGNPIDLPGLAVLNAGLGALTTSISCSSNGNCTIGGAYTDVNGNLQAFVASDANGTWGDALELPGTSALNVGGGAIVDAVSCTSTGDCGASGLYADPSGNTQAFVTDSTSGSWANAIEVPDSPTVQSDGTGGNPVTISCSSGGNCSAGGAFVDTLGVVQAFVVNEWNGVWGDDMGLTTSISQDADNAFVASISCSTDSGCGAGGWFLPSSNVSQAFTSTMTPQFMTPPPLTLASKHGVVGKKLLILWHGIVEAGQLTFTVVDGTAKGCAVSKQGILAATGPGTCLVTIHEGGNTTYLPASDTWTVVMYPPARPPTLTVEFFAASGALTTATVGQLSTLARRLISGASLIVTGFAPGNAALARVRALAVERFLSEKLALHVTIRTNTSAGADTVTVATTKQ